jgi:hypothetical protein
MMRAWMNLVEGIGARWGRIYAIARRAEAQLSVAALHAVEQWQQANWTTGPLTKAYASQSKVMQEITQAFAPVRAAIENEFGPTVRLYRGHKAGQIAGRQLYSWSAHPKKAQQFIGGKPLRIWSDAEIEAMIAKYERTGFVRVGNRRFVRMKDNPEFYLIYDRHNQVITDGDDLRADILSMNADRQDYNDRLSQQGRLLSADIPVDRIVWMPANALSMELIVVGDPEQLVEGRLHHHRKRILLTSDHISSMRELMCLVEASVRPTGFKPGPFEAFYRQVVREGSIMFGAEEDELPRHEVRNWIATHSKLFKKSTITIWRTMRLPTDVVVYLKPGTKLGNHWTYEFDDSVIEGFDVSLRNPEAGTALFVFEATIDAADVFFPLTVAYNVYFPHEQEVFLDSRVARPKIVSVRFFDTKTWSLEEDNFRPDLVGAEMRA